MLAVESSSAPSLDSDPAAAAVAVRVGEGVRARSRASCAVASARASRSRCGRSSRSSGVSGVLHGDDVAAGLLVFARERVEEDPSSYSPFADLRTGAFWVPSASVGPIPSGNRRK